MLNPRISIERDVVGGKLCTSSVQIWLRQQVRDSEASELESSGDWAPSLEFRPWKWLLPELMEVKVVGEEPQGRQPLTYPLAHWPWHWEGVCGWDVQEETQEEVEAGSGTQVHHSERTASLRSGSKGSCEFVHSKQDRMVVWTVGGFLPKEAQADSALDWLG